MPQSSHPSQPNAEALQPYIPAAHAEELLARIEDFALCSDLRMYAWSVRRNLEADDADSQRISYSREVEAEKTRHAEAALAEIQDFVSQISVGQLPELTVRQQKPTSSSISEMLRAWESSVAELKLPHALLRTTAAAGLVVSSWRDVLEPWHYLFTDAEMSWMSVVATRDVAACMDVASNVPDIESAITILTDGHRKVLPGITAHDALGPAWTNIARRISRRLNEKREAIPHTVHSLAGWAGFICSGWWGCPRWRAIANTAAHELGLNQYRRRQLAVEPWKLPFDVWERVIQQQKSV